jgi:transposase-like protein
MALVELSMLEQRYLAVREVLDTGATVTDVAARHGVDRRTLHRAACFTLRRRAMQDLAPCRRSEGVVGDRT